MSEYRRGGEPDRVEISRVIREVSDPPGPAKRLGAGLTQVNTQHDASANYLATAIYMTRMTSPAVI